MKKLNIALIGLIALSGVFNYKLFEDTRFYPAQFAFFVFSVGLLGSYLIYQKNRWLGLLAGVCAFGFLKTFLCQHAPQGFLFESAIGLGAIFGLYYIVRHLKLKEDLLKFFLIPAGLNIILIIVQAFDHNFLSFMPVEGVTGFLGSKGVTACFLAMTTPLFLKHFKWGLPFLIGALVLCKSVVAIFACLGAVLCYLYCRDKIKLRLIVLVVILLATILLVCWQEDILKVEMQQRACMWVGTLDGIKHNPILGWGLGSFEPVVARIPQLETKYCGYYFNYEGSVMNHPHNEILWGWWSFGILFPIFAFLYGWSLIKKFTKDKLLSFPIIVAGCICLMGYFMSYPAWFLFVFALGIYENTEVEIWR